MSRKIENEMIKAIQNKTEYRNGNTRVYQSSEGFRVVCHKTSIVTQTFNLFRLDSGGWESKTTKSRINAVLLAIGSPYRLIQTQNRWYLTKPNELPNYIDFVDGIILPQH
jgi:hypothetical protein